MRVLVAVALSISTAVTLATAAPQTSSSRDRDRTLARFFAPQTPPLVSYRALRTLSASTRGGKFAGSVVAQTSLDPAAGFSYSIVSQDGSGLVCRRVLIAALDAERKAMQDGDGARAALTFDNYDFLAMTNDDALLKVDIKPRRKAVMLIDGSLFLKPDNAELVRVEGELSARPSFWTRRVRVVREYAEIAGVHVPVGMRSVADVLIVGQSTFAMTYRYQEINGQAISAAAATR